MTTINNDQSLIEKVGGIDRAREIVKWQSESSWADHYCISENTIGSAGRKFSEELCSKNNDFVLIDDLRTAIAKHDNAQLCIGCGSPDLHKGGEIKEPKMCLDCFAEMVGFTRTSNGFVESDEVTDIRNHVSPSTRVIDHG